MSIRCFVAIELQAGIQKKLDRVQTQLQRELSEETGIKWVKPEQTHLTLKFLGDIDDLAVPDICQAVDRAVEGVEPFEVVFGGLGSFPLGKPARVAWVGITDGVEPLAGLQHAVEEQLAEIGFAPEHRQFNGHLTLGRIRQVRTGHRVREVVEQTKVETVGAQEVAEVKVFQSEPTKSGPRYTVLHHVTLGT